MTTPFDWLSAAEKCEDRVAELESFSRRHRARLLLTGAVLLACVALYLVPVAKARSASPRQAASPLRSGRPDGTAFRPPGASQGRSGGRPREKSGRIRGGAASSRRDESRAASPRPEGSPAPSGRGGDGATDDARSGARAGSAGAPAEGTAGAPSGGSTPGGSPAGGSTAGASTPGGSPAGAEAGSPTAVREGPAADGGCDDARAASTQTPSPARGQGAAGPRGGPVSPPGFIWIHVAGAVARPGAVRVPVGARAFQAVAAAGGILPRADLTRVNLARALVDEGIIIVPSTSPAVSTGEPPGAGADGAGTGAAPAPSGETSSGPRAAAGKRGKEGKSLPTQPLDLNSATAEQLETLPGLGSALALAIVDWRERHGPYRQIRDLLQVPRIGRRLLVRLEPHLCVFPPGEKPP